MLFFGRKTSTNKTFPTNRPLPEDVFPILAEYLGGGELEGLKYRQPLSSKSQLIEIMSSHSPIQVILKKINPDLMLCAIKK